MFIAPASSDWYFVESGFVRFTPEGFFVALCITLLGGAAFAALLEAPIERIRHRFAPRSLGGVPQ